MFDPEIVNRLARALAVEFESEQPDYDAKYYREQAERLLRRMFIEGEEDHGKA